MRKERPEFLRVQFCEVRLLVPDDPLILHLLELLGPGLGEAEVHHPDVVVVVPVHVVNTQVHRHHETGQLPAHWLLIGQLSQGELLIGGKRFISRKSCLALILRLFAGREKSEMESSFLII